MKKSPCHIWPLINKIGAFLWVAVLLLPLLSFGQSSIKIEGLNVQLRSIAIDHADTVNFMYVNATQKTDQTLLFIQGSGPRPLFVKDKGEYIFTLPFDIKHIVDDFHMNLLVVAPPGVNNVEDMNVLNDQALKYDENQIPVVGYRKGANLKSYIRSYHAALDYFSDKTPDARFFVFGHSQGSRIAAALATDQKQIQKVVLASTNPISRGYETISKVRIEQLLGQVSFEEAQASINQELRRIEYLESSAEKTLEDDSELSFTYPSLLQYMLKLQQPILFVYGTNDYGISLDADKIPISFIKEGKTNLAVKAYEGRDHNFFKGKDYGWNQVMEDCMNWFLY